MYPQINTFLNIIFMLIYFISLHNIWIEIISLA